MKLFTPEEISELRQIATDTEALLASFDESDSESDLTHRKEVAEQIREMTRQGSRFRDFARMVLDWKIESTINSFVECARQFYRDAAEATEAAHESSLVRALCHERELTHDWGLPSFTKERKAAARFNELLDERET